MDWNITNSNDTIPDQLDELHDLAGKEHATEKE